MRTQFRLHVSNVADEEEALRAIGAAKRIIAAESMAAAMAAMQQEARKA
jgi:hypothetical protein